MEPTFLLDQFGKHIHTIPQALYNSQANFGSRGANLYKEDGQWITINYNQLIEKVENIAMGFIKLGANLGDFIGIKAPNSVRWTWADMACLFAGAASVSIYPSLLKKDTVFIANHSEMKFLVVQDQQGLEEIQAYLDEMPTVKGLICLEKGFKGNGSSVYGLDELMEMGEQARKELLPIMKERHEQLNAKSPAILVYTSGTTGALKGVLHPHKHIIWAIEHGLKYFADHGHPQDYRVVTMCLLPLSDIMEKINDYYGALTIGAMIGFAESPATMFDDMQIIKPNWVMLVPRILSRVYLLLEQKFSATEEGKKLWDWAMDVALRTSYALEDEHGCINTTIPYEEQLSGDLREEWLKAYDMVFWRFHYVWGGEMRDINCGGAALDPELHRKYLGMGTWSIGYGYGSTESGGGITEAPPDSNKMGWTGPPNPGLEMKLDDDGELLLRGDGIITEYFKDDEANATCFTEDGWFRTGDIGEFDELGRLRIIDRKKSLIILDTGKNVSTVKIESLCDTSPLLDQVAVFGQDRKYISALVVPNLDIILAVLQSRGITLEENQVKYDIQNGIPVCVKIPTAIVEQEAIVNAVQAEIDRVNEQLEDYERIKKIKILPFRFTENNGEVTPSQKLKMNVIEKKYQPYLDELYT